MSIEITAVQKVNPQDRTAPRKFYASAVSSGEISLKNIGERIATMSSMNRADVIASLDLLLQVMREEISQGRIIRLGDFGSFSVTISSEGQDKEESVNGTIVTDARLNFRPGAELNNTLRNLTYKKTKSATPVQI